LWLRCGLPKSLGRHDAADTMHVDRMRRHLLAMLGSLSAPGWARAAAAVTMAPLPLRERRLANGLQVVTLPERDAATVSVQMWYRVGGKDDPPHRSGFAHLFEHMMFKSTRHMPNEMFDRLTEDVGGNNNAVTAEDVTSFHNEVPSNHAERLLWAEAERMSNLTVDQGNFDSERKVVQEELRQRVYASPYGRLFNAIPSYAFEVHPYKQPGIGSIEDLDAATLDDVRSFHTTYYRPDNALLIVAGGFEPDAVDASVERYFGPLSAPAAPIPRVTVKEPPRAANASAQLHGPNVPLPAVALLWKGPPAASADTPALQVAAALLSSGESSRLNEALVYRAQIAQQAVLSVESYADAGVIAAYAIAASGKPLPQVQAALLREIERLAQQPIAAAELDKVRTGLLTSALVGRQTPYGKATAVGWGAILRNDVRYADRELAELQAVTAADVQRVLKRHLLDAHRVDLTYTQGAGT
jgi:zinc protease